METQSTRFPLKELVEGKVVLYDKFEKGVGWYKCRLCEEWWSYSLLRTLKEKQVCGCCFNRFDKNEEWLNANCEAYVHRLNEFDGSRGRKPLPYVSIALFLDLRGARSLRADALL